MDKVDQVLLFLDAESHHPLADCPAMSFVLFGDIAGSGDPLYVAELCNWHYYGQRRSIRLILFAKRAFHIQIVSEEANNPLKNGQEPSQKGDFSQNSQPLVQNTRNEGSLKSGIHETRDRSIRWPADGAACSCVKSD